MTSGYSQKGNNSLKFHGGVELPVGHLADVYKPGLGIYVTDYINLREEGSLVVTVGLMGWKAQENTGSAAIWSTRLGYRQLLPGKFYVQADAGHGIGLKNFTGTKRIVAGGGPGYLFSSKKGNAGFDISARINFGFNRTWVGFGAGYQFKL